MEEGWESSVKKKTTEAQQFQACDEMFILWLKLVGNFLDSCQEANS